MSQYNQGQYGRPPPNSQQSYSSPPPNTYGQQQVYGGGQQQQYHPPPQSQSSVPPPGADPQLFFWFKAVDTDGSGSLTTEELQKALINDWKKCFQRFDTDGSGTINFTELKTALKTFGYNLSDQFISLLIKKYDKRAGTTGKGDVTFDNFVQSCVTIKTLTDSFRRFDTDNDGWIMISYEQFLELVVNNR
ncbi:9712_t:CDS:2 [Entrophospora sp. SA101]|nr:1613_t:CDS:2 [Entrophospora sp. SA101]CAJ0645653.1 9712_t:CDS:2 [Entrophospora sp. SA101]CAJ0843144.1 1681_t:CDS:2 [Entrophospora sp. SA101]CAJ0879645.1 9709_t:CDS:2 [Entrophospora sp. SA101]